MPDLLGHYRVVRFLGPDQFLFTAAEGERIHSSFLSSRVPESGFVEELGGTVEVLQELEPDFRRHGIVRLTIYQLQNLGLTFSLLPEGNRRVRDAHGEIGGVTRGNRPEILTRLELDHLDRPPERYETVEIPCRNCMLKFDAKIEHGYDLARDTDGFKCECGEFVRTEGPVIEVS